MNSFLCNSYLLFIAIVPQLLSSFIYIRSLKEQRFVIVGDISDKAENPFWYYFYEVFLGLSILIAWILGFNFVIRIITGKFLFLPPPVLYLISLFQVILYFGAFRNRKLSAESQNRVSAGTAIGASMGLILCGIARDFLRQRFGDSTDLVMLIVIVPIFVIFCVYVYRKYGKGAKKKQQE